jgi:hypothetical protein
MKRNIMKKPTQLQEFYKWYTEKVKGQYIENDEFERLVVKFDKAS